MKRNIRTTVVCLLVIVAGVALAGCMDDGGEETTDPGTDDGQTGDESPSEDGSQEDTGSQEESSGDDGTHSSNLDTPDAWPLQGLDAANTAAFGSSDGGSGEELWSTSTTESPSAAAIADGLVYVTVKREVVALNPDSGERAWSIEFDEPTTHGAPVTDGETVYVGVEVDRLEYKAVALDADSGEERWSVEMDAKPSRPAVANGRVVFSSSGIVALDTETGEELWTFSEGGGGGFTLHEDRVFVLAGEGVVYALDAASGDKLWEASGPKNGVALPAPAVSDGKVFVAYSSTLAALDIETGDGLWNHKIDTFFGNSAPAVAGGLVFVGDAGGGPNEGTLYAVDTETGEEAWTFDTGAATRTSPVVTDEQVFVAVPTSPGETTAYAVDRSSGEEAWSTPLRGTVGLQPAFVDGVLFVPTGNLHALDA